MMNWMAGSPAATPLQEPGAAAVAQLPPQPQLQLPMMPPPPPRQDLLLRPVVHAEQAAADAGKEVGAVVLTVKGSLRQPSYDELFSRVPQQGSAGTRVAVYECTFSALAQIMAQVAASPAAPAEAPTAFEQLAAEIDHVAPASVVLNLECCQCCS